MSPDPNPHNRANAIRRAREILKGNAKLQVATNELVLSDWLMDFHDAPITTPKVEPGTVWATKPDGSTNHRPHFFLCMGLKSPKLPELSMRALGHNVGSDLLTPEEVNRQLVPVTDWPMVWDACNESVTVCTSHELHTVDKYNRRVGLRFYDGQVLVCYADGKRWRLSELSEEHDTAHLRLFSGKTVGQQRDIQGLQFLRDHYGPAACRTDHSRPTPEATKPEPAPLPTAGAVWLKAVSAFLEGPNDAREAKLKETSGALGRSLAHEVFKAAARKK